MHLPFRSLVYLDFFDILGIIFKFYLSQTSGESHLPIKPVMPCKRKFQEPLLVVSSGGPAIIVPISSLEGPHVPFLCSLLLHQWEARLSFRRLRLSALARRPWPCVSARVALARFRPPGILLGGVLKRIIVLWGPYCDPPPLSRKLACESGKLHNMDIIALLAVLRCVSMLAA